MSSLYQTNIITNKSSLVVLPIANSFSATQLPEVEKHSLTASIGAYFCQQSEIIDDSIRKADLAMYCAKAQGRDQLVVYTPTLGETRVVL